MKQYIVDAFTSRLFHGNPAAVCVLEKWPSSRWMIQVATENNLSETAFLVKEGDGYRIRWFTPETEVELCGHATLASAFVILNFIEPEATKVKFYTEEEGELQVFLDDFFYCMDFPTYPLKEIPVTDEMEKAFGQRPTKALLGLDLICVFDYEKSIQQMAPNQDLLCQLPGRLQNITAPSVVADCSSRTFGPKLGIIEDPVCGSAHCQIGEYWAKMLEKEEIIAYQASNRGGFLKCKPLENGRIQISGEAVLFSTAQIPDPWDL